jgi:Uma2 family endonuclease
MERAMPVTIRMVSPMSDDKFFQFCQINDTLEFERDSHGNIVLMSPTSLSTASLNFRMGGILFNWYEQIGLGEFFDSSSGFTLPNGAVRSPDISWISSEKLSELDDQEREKFAHICPDFVIEIRSKSDSKQYVLDKMKEYIENGTRLGWMIDRFERKVHLFREDGSVTIDNFNAVLSGENVLPGLLVDLGALMKKPVS